MDAARQVLTEMRDFEASRRQSRDSEHAHFLAVLEAMKGVREALQEFIDLMTTGLIGTTHESAKMTVGFSNMRLVFRWEHSGQPFEIEFVPGGPHLSYKKTNRPYVQLHYDFEEEIPQSALRVVSETVSHLIQGRSPP